MRRALLILTVVLCLPAQADAGTLFLIDGRGWGHGIGMSQYGARGYAEAGWGYRRILAHYYPTTRLTVVPARPVRVLLVEGKAAVKISSAKPFKVVDARGKVRRLKPGTRRLVAGRIAAARLPLRYVPGAAPLVLNGNAYRGTLLVHRRNGTLTVVNKLPLDRYLRGVVPWEMPDDWHPEALRAQAVVARSYALATLKPGKLYDLYADTRSQVYGGVQAEAVSTNLAIGSTAGRVLMWNGSVATTFYHSTSGGRTVSIGGGLAAGDTGSIPRLGGRPARRALEAPPLGPVPADPGQVGKRLGLGPVRDLIATRGPSGRVTDGEAEARARDADDARRRTSGARSICARPGSRSACSASSSRAAARSRRHGDRSCSRASCAGSARSGSSGR